jgi:hypothetical protein
MATIRPAATDIIWALAAAKRAYFRSVEPLRKHSIVSFTTIVQLKLPHHQ